MSQSHTRTMYVHILFTLIIEIPKTLYLFAKKTNNPKTNAV